MYAEKEIIIILTEFEKFENFMGKIATYSEPERVLVDQDPSNEVLLKGLIDKELEYIDLHFNINNEVKLIFRSIISLSKIKNKDSEEFELAILEIYSLIYQKFGLQVLLAFKNNVLLRGCEPEESESNKESEMMLLFNKVFENFKNKTFLTTSLKSLCSRFIAKNKNFFDDGYNFSTYGLSDSVKRKIDEQEELLLVEQTDDHFRALKKQNYTP